MTAMSRAYGSNWQDGVDVGTVDRVEENSVVHVRH